MSGIIDIGTLEGSLSSEQKLTGILSGENKISGGKLSTDITHRSYNDLVDKPSINAVTLEGDKSFEELGLAGLTNQEIDKIIDENGGMY